MADASGAPGTGTNIAGTSTLPEPGNPNSNPASGNPTPSQTPDPPTNNVVPMQQALQQQQQAQQQQAQVLQMPQNQVLSQQHVMPSGTQALRGPMPQVQVLQPVAAANSPFVQQQFFQQQVNMLHAMQAQQINMIQNRPATMGPKSPGLMSQTPQALAIKPGGQACSSPVAAVSVAPGMVGAPRSNCMKAGTVITQQQHAAAGTIISGKQVLQQRSGSQPLVIGVISSQGQPKGGPVMNMGHTQVINSPTQLRFSTHPTLVTSTGQQIITSPAMLNQLQAMASLQQNIGQQQMFAQQGGAILGSQPVFIRPAGSLGPQQIMGVQPVRAINAAAAGVGGKPSDQVGLHHSSSQPHLVQSAAGQVAPPPSQAFPIVTVASTVAATATTGHKLVPQQTTTEKMIQVQPSNILPSGSTMRPLAPHPGKAALIRPQVAPSTSSPSHAQNKTTATMATQSTAPVRSPASSGGGIVQGAPPPKTVGQTTQTVHASSSTKQNHHHHVQKGIPIKQASASSQTKTSKTIERHRNLFEAVNRPPLNKVNKPVVNGTVTLSPLPAVPCSTAGGTAAETVKEEMVAMEVVESNGDGATTTESVVLPSAEEKQKQRKAMVKANSILTHIVEGFMIQEGPEPFPVQRSSLMTDCGTSRAADSEGSRDKESESDNDVLEEPVEEGVDQTVVLAPVTPSVMPKPTAQSPRKSTPENIGGSTHVDVSPADFASMESTTPQAGETAVAMDTGGKILSPSEAIMLEKTLTRKRGRPPKNPLLRKPEVLQPESVLCDTPTGPSSNLVDLNRCKMKCEYCGKIDTANKFKRSKRFCSMACAKRFNVGCSRRMGAYRHSDDKLKKTPKARSPRGGGGGRGGGLKNSAGQQRASPGSQGQGRPLGDGSEDMDTMPFEEAVISEGVDETCPRPPASPDDFDASMNDMVSTATESMTTGTSDDERSTEGSSLPGGAREASPCPSPPLLEREAEMEIVPACEPERRHPSSWSVTDVYEFITSLQGCAQYADEFRQQEIDGQALLLLKEDHLMTAMSMKLGPALKICARITTLKEEHSAP